MRLISEHSDQEGKTCRLNYPMKSSTLCSSRLHRLSNRLVDQRVEQKRPLLLSVGQVAEELSCTRASVYGLIRGGHLEAVHVNGAKRYHVATETLKHYVEELVKPAYQRQLVSSDKGPAFRRQRTPPSCPGYEAASTATSEAPIGPKGGGWALHRVPNGRDIRVHGGLANAVHRTDRYRPE
jgi:excisionase family DNA binding protein